MSVVSGVEMKFYERWLQALLLPAPRSFAARSRVLARVASLAEIGELARRLFITRFFLDLVLYSCFVSLFLFLFFYYFFWEEKTMFSFQTLLKGTFSLVTCHLQFSITARVSMSLKRQSVESLAGHKLKQPALFA